jgi:hypothetical protein
MAFVAMFLESWFCSEIFLSYDRDRRKESTIEAATSCESEKEWKMR